MLAQMQFEKKFEDIRPYRDEEVAEVMKRLVKDPIFDKVLMNLYKEREYVERVKAALLKTNTINDFQTNFVVPYLNQIISESTDGVTIGGLEYIEQDRSYVFISNHRDIILDAALMNIEIKRVGLNTTEIAIGSNLLIYQWIIDMFKLNRAFVVARNTTLKQRQHESQRLSEYIRYLAKHRGDSVWISQREGRTKDGNDQTQVSVLKMLNMSNQADFDAGFRELNLVPLSISYEIEPCGNEKVAELLKRQSDATFTKTERDDLWSMVSGLKNQKGRIHLQFGKPVAELLEDIAKAENVNQSLNELAEYIDSEIYRNYKLWPNNYIAYDIFYKTKKYSDMYTVEELEKFNKLIHERLELVNEVREEAKMLWLSLYAAPVFNYENCKCHRK
jgi:glycerol-3-phosphate O-acyltransferase